MEQMVMSKATGKFMKKHMQAKKIEFYVGDEQDRYSYADNDAMSYVLIVGTFKDYDAESGVITMTAETGHEFYLAESKIDMFWLSGNNFNIMDTSTSTIRSGKKRLKSKKRDII